MIAHDRPGREGEYNFPVLKRARSLTVGALRGRSLTLRSSGHSTMPNLTGCYYMEFAVPHTFSSSAAKAFDERLPRRCKNRATAGREVRVQA